MPEPLIERINAAHACDGFRCKHNELQQYVRRFALASDQNDLGTTHVAIDPDDHSVVGYYTLVAATVLAKEIPEDESKFHFKTIGVVLIGMLAVDKKRKRQKIGEKIFIHALRKAEEISQRCGAYAVIVDSLSTDEAIGFYKKYGFQNLKRDGDGRTTPMFIFMRQIREMIVAAKSAADPILSP